MVPLVIDRTALPESVSSYFAASRIAIIPQWGGDVTLSPVVDSDVVAPPTRAEIDELCNRLAIDTTGYVFDRNEANNYG